jgi:hypothetical protein
MIDSCRGLVLSCSLCPGVARGLAYAVARRLDLERRVVVAIGASLPTCEAGLRRAPTIGDALDAAPDAVVLDGLPEGAEAGRLLLAAERCLVVAVSRDPGPAEAVLGWLERGVRPSLFAHSLRAVLATGAEAPHRVVGVAVGDELRARIAVDDRHSVYRLLTGGGC